MGYEYCEKHDAEATNGCYECAREALLESDDAWVALSRALERSARDLRTRAETTRARVPARMRRSGDDRAALERAAFLEGEARGLSDAGTAVLHARLEQFDRDSVAMGRRAPGH